jgi:hypothetical protein
LEVFLSGEALDKLSISSRNNGVYNSQNSSIVWSLTNSIGATELAPGEGGQVSLSFASILASALAEGTHDIRLDFSLTGVPVGSPEQRPLTTNEVRTVRISSQVNLSSKTLRSLGPFANQGPIPPKVGEETTYAVIFNVGNTRGDLTNVQVTAQLGTGVTWLGAQSVSNENISYDEASNTVMWNLGALPSGSGFSSNVREVAFQIALNPLLSQVGIAPTMVNNITFSGRDTITGDIVTASNPSLSTRLVNDPAFIQGDDIVVR